MDKKKVYHNALGQNKSFIAGEQPDGWIAGRYIDPKSKEVANQKRKATTGQRKWFHNTELTEQSLFQTGMQPEGWVAGRLPFIKEKSRGKEVWNDGTKEYFLSEDDSKEGLIKGRLQSTLDRMKVTNQERYGVDNIFKDPTFIARRKEMFADEEWVQKADAARKKTCIEKYGTEYYLQSDACRLKTKQTCLEKYGVEHSSQSPEAKEKTAKTKLDKYGISSYNNPDKVKATCMEKYGVEYACQLQQCKVKGNNSQPNRFFSSLLQQAGINYEAEFPIENRSYDFKVGNILIEINPSITHNSTISPFKCQPKEKDYHLNKSLLAERYGYRCIHIWDWDDVNKVIELLQKRNRVYARSCVAREVTKSDADQLLQSHHLQGTARASIYVGLFYNEQLVSVMTFGKPRYNSRYQYELVRYCSIYQVVGGAEKLFSYFLKTYNADSVVSYCDCSKFQGNVYTKLGFSLQRITVSKHWFNLKTHQHITDNLLRQRGFDQLFHTQYGKGTSNQELMKEAGFVEVYDAGQSTYLWEREI